MSRPRPDSHILLHFPARHPATIGPHLQHDSKEVSHAYLYNSVTVDRTGYS
jgi:hypothetical protein